MPEKEIDLLNLTVSESPQNDDMQDKSFEDLLTLIQTEHVEGDEEHDESRESFSMEELKMAVTMFNHDYLLDIYRHYYSQVDILELLAEEEEESEGMDVESDEGEEEEEEMD